MENKILAREEEQDLRMGQELYEVTQMSGFQTIKGWLEDMAIHSWVDPRETNNREEWEWRELNAFHAANNARELLERIQKAVSQSEYLAKIKSGEISRRSMKL